MAAEVKELNALLLQQSEARLKDAYDRSAPTGWGGQRDEK